jgi:cell division protease FtsH
MNRSLMVWLLILAGLLIALMFVHQSMQSREEISISEFWTYVDNAQVTGRIEVTTDEIRGKLVEDLPGVEYQDFYVKYDYRTDDGFQERLDEALARNNYPAQVYYPPQSIWTSIWPNLLMIALVLGLLFFVFRRFSAAAGGGGMLGSFGRSRHRLLTKEQTKVTFKDVAGIEEAKDEVSEIVEFLRNPNRFARLGGRIPRGVLLVGEPGCGKTLLAKAIAGEADVPFFSISGSDFVEMFVGVGASRVRDLFKQAKESSPCIIFLDEIDAVGRKRGVGFGGGGHDEREQTLNAILVEMDGFESSDQVIVIAATNRVDVLDPALTRPGRFDRQITVPLPDLQGRAEILSIYANKVKIGPDVDLRRLARGTPMFSGADLAALINEAAIAATMADKDFVEQEDLEEARDKVRWGRARKSRVIDEKEKQITAYHEAGHALVQLLLPEADPLHKVSIIPRGAAGGATFSLPEKDRYLYTRAYCKALLCVCFGGRLAEDLVFNDISSGASNDILQATQIARKMVLDWGMSERVGMIAYNYEERQASPMDHGAREYSERTAELIDTEIKNLIEEARSTTAQMLTANRAKLDAVAEALLKYETLSADEVRRVVDGRGLDKPTVTDLIDREAGAAEKASQGVDWSPPAVPDKPEPSGGAMPEPG